jgi:predicted thioesterase
MASKPEVGKSLTKKMVVSADNTAAFFASENGESYADVLGTPFLIAEMERVCAAILQPYLKQGQVSVGAHIDVRHLASTAVGANYSISATLLENRWGLYTFEVVAKDMVGVIGKGKIVRAVANLSDIKERAQQSLD